MVQKTPQIVSKAYSEKSLSHLWFWSPTPILQEKHGYQFPPVVSDSLPPHGL